MNDKTICCFTGHRSIPAGLEKHTNDVFRDAIKKLISMGVTTFRAGGAMGIDTVAAAQVLEMKKEFPHIRLELCLPCKNQVTGTWPDEAKREYYRILEECDSYSYVAERYTPSCMHARNRKLADGAGYCLAFYDGGGKGGTKYTVEYAAKHGVEVINLYQTVLGRAETGK